MNEFADRAGVAPRLALGADRDAGAISLAIVKAAMQSPRREDPDEMTIRKFGKTVALPPQNSNGLWADADPSRAGGVADSTLGYEDGPTGQRSSRTGDPHSASIRVGRPPPQNTDVTTKSIADIHKKGPKPMFSTAGRAEADDEDIDPDDDELAADARRSVRRKERV